MKLFDYYSDRNIDFEILKYLLEEFAERQTDINEQVSYDTEPTSEMEKILCGNVAPATSKRVICQAGHLTERMVPDEDSIVLGSSIPGIGPCKVHFTYYWPMGHDGSKLKRKPGQKRATHYEDSDTKEFLNSVLNDHRDLV